MVNYFLRSVKWILSGVAIVLVPISANSQQGKIDSLISVIDRTVGIAKFDVLISLVRAYGGMDANLEAYKYAEQARNIAYYFGDSTRIVTASRIKGQLCIRMSRAIEAETILLTV